MRFFEAKAHGSQGMGNPLFPRKESPKSRWPWIIAVMLATGVVTSIAGIVYGPYFEIETIEVNGTVTLAPEDIDAELQKQLLLKRLFVLPNSHRLFFDAASAEVMLQKNFPLKSVDIQKNGSTLTVVIEEDIFMVAFRSGEAIYWLDPTGKIIRVAEPNEMAAVLTKVGVSVPEGTSLAVINNDMPVIQEKTATERLPDEQVVTEVVIDNVIAFSHGLRSVGINPNEFVSDDIGLPWFTVTSDKPYTILFDATKDVNTQLSVLKAVVEERFATPGDVPRYIDVRFGNRVYVR